MTRIEDIEFLYRIFLGREQEAGADQSERLALGIVDIARAFIESAEFNLTVYTPMTSGKAVHSPIFDTMPTDEMRSWIGLHLPLSPEGRADVAAATSWFDLHKVLFADPVFCATVIPPGWPSEKLAGARRPTKVEDIEFLYRILLGREQEAGADQSERLALGIVDIARAFIESAEFNLNVLRPMMVAQPVRSLVFNTPPTDEMRRWIKSHLPLSPEGSARLEKVSSWYDLHLALFTDPTFCRVIIDPGSPADELRITLLVHASRLFERDWYLDTYRDVAATRGDPFEHFMLNGVAEGRNPNRLFDTRWYLSAYHDIMPQGMNPLVHYVLEGAQRACDPHPFFSAAAVTKAYPPAVQSALTPLAYFLNIVVPADPSLFPKFSRYDVYKVTRNNARHLERSALLSHIEIMIFKPIFIIFIDGLDEEVIEVTRRSLYQQIYSEFHIIDSIDDLSEMRAGSEKTVQYLLWLDAGDELAPEALYEMAAALNAHPQLDMIYFDHEAPASYGLSEAFHKPAWSPDYFESHDYIGSAACVELSRSIGFLTASHGRYDFYLRFTEKYQEIAHVKKVLLRVSADKVSDLSPEDEAINVRAIEGRLARTGRAGIVTANIPRAASYDVKITLRHEPLVSVIIPTAGRVISYEGRQIDLIVECLESITEKSSYKNLEFVIIDNGDFNRNRLSHININSIKLITYSSSEVNIAEKINLGASHASGEVFLILNDDIEPLTDDWIERMLGHLEKPHVGVVGAKLLYPNGTIQHAGIAMCDGHPEHVRRGKPRNDIGYGFSTCGVRNYIGVTGAVSMTPARCFRLVGGYSEKLPIDYNDVDYSYKLLEAGYQVVYEPKAELTHYESVSAIRLPRPQDAQYFASRWASLVNDPFYNQYCLSKHPAMFEPAYSEPQY